MRVFRHFSIAVLPFPSCVGNANARAESEPFTMPTQCISCLRSDFKEKMRDPSCYYLVKSIKTYVAHPLRLQSVAQ